MDILITVIAIPLINWLVEWAKTKYDIDWKIVLVIVSLIVWAIYAIFQFYVPETFQQDVIAFMSKASIWAVLVYEYLLKNLKD